MKKYLNYVFLLIQKELYGNQKNVCPRELSWNK